jgi:hypothetical protein
VLSSCATEEFANASPEVVEDCRREVALLTDAEIFSGEEDDALRGPAPESAPDPIEDARTAREEAGSARLSSWPREALMYRCLESRGVALTADQTAILAEWEGQLDPDSSGSQE